MVVKRLRQAWPTVKIVVRGDRGFCRWRLLRWCDRHDVHDIVGLAKNERLLALAPPLLAQAAPQFEHSQQQPRVFGAIEYAAHTWERARRVILRGAQDEGRAHRPGAPSALRGDQPPRGGPNTLRCSVRHPRCDGASEQERVLSEAEGNNRWGCWPIARVATAGGRTSGACYSAAWQTPCWKRGGGLVGPARNWRAPNAARCG